MTGGVHFQPVNRRRILRSAGALVAAGLAGCVGGQPGTPTDTPTDNSDQPGTPANTPTGSPNRPPHSFAVTATRCGAQVNRADVTFGDGTVTVEGTTWGNDACYTARLAGVTLSGETLTLRVAAERRDDVQGCAQCITEIDYRATVEVPETPSEVVVVHRGERVETARP